MSVIINYNGTGFRPGDTVNITADFNTSVAHAKISITEQSKFILTAVIQI